MRRYASKGALLSLAIDSRFPGAHKRAVDVAQNRAQHASGLAPRIGAALGGSHTSSAPAQTSELARIQRLRLDQSRHTLVARLNLSAERAAQSGNSRVSVRIGGGGAALETGVTLELDGDGEALLLTGLPPSTPLRRGADAELEL